MRAAFDPWVGKEDPLEEGMATHSSVLAWRIPWTEEPGGLWCMGLQRVGHDWATYTHTQTHPGFSSSDGFIFSFFILLFTSEKKKKVKIVNVISESEFSEYWSCSKDSKMCSKHDKMWLFKSTFLKHHETYLTLTVGKNNSERKACYIPHQRETIFFLCLSKPKFWLAQVWRV